MFALRAGAVAWLFSIGGSVLAVVVIYILAAPFGLDYLSFLARIPGISPALIERVGADLTAGGLPYTPFMVAGGVPLKLYAAQAFALGLSLGSTLVWTLFARVVRIAPSYAVVAAVRWAAGRRIDARPLLWLVLLCLVWTVFYLFYFVRMGQI